MNIFLFNQYAGNKGDRAVLYALGRLLLELVPKAKITVSTSNPEMYEEYPYFRENGMDFVPSAWDYQRVDERKWYWNLLDKFHKYSFTILREAYLRNTCKWVARFFINPHFYKAVNTADIIISVGGHHYCTLLSRDIVSSINFDAMAVKLLGKSFTCFSQTFGPFDFFNDRNRKLTYKLLSTSELYAREEDSEKALKDFMIPDSVIHRTHETVLSLNGLFNSYVKPSDRTKRIGVSIYCTQKRSKKEEDNYCDSISEFCNYAVSLGYEIVFFPMEIKGTPPDDRSYIQAIINRIHEKQYCRVIDNDLETFIHLEEVSKCQLYLGHKTHSTIFALATGTPLIAIAYHQKTMGFMKQFGLEKYAVKETELTPTSIVALLDLLLKDIDEVGQRSFEKSRQYTSEIKDDLLNILKQRI